MEVINSNRPLRGILSQTPFGELGPSGLVVDVVTGPRRDVVGILVLLNHFLYKPIKMLFTISKITPHTCVSKANF